MLSAVITHARITFQHYDPESRTEALQCVVASSFAAYARLVGARQGGDRLPGRFWRDWAAPGIGPTVASGGRLDIGDVLGRYCQVEKRIVVERLDHFDDEENQWQEAVDANAAAVKPGRKVRRDPPTN